MVAESALAAIGETAEALAPRVCGQQFDGLLLLGPPAAGAQELRIVNRDGSDGGCCLNGCRVVARLLGQRQGRLRMAGQLLAWREVHAGIELALPLLAAQLPSRRLLLPAAIPGEEVRVQAVQFWNPHVVVDLAAAQSLLDVEDSFASFPLARLAARLRQERAAFPQGVNVGLRRAIDSGGKGPERWQLRVDERGVGETAACGSGALAAAAVAWTQGSGARQELEMAGGRLLVEQDASGRIHLSGKAQVGPPLTLASLLRGASK